MVMANRSPKSLLAGRHRRFADQMFSFIEISFLLGYMDDDFGRTWHIVAFPITGWSWRNHRLHRVHGRLLRRFHLFAAAPHKRGRSSAKKLKKTAEFHGSGGYYASRFAASTQM